VTGLFWGLNTNSAAPINDHTGVHVGLATLLEGDTEDPWDEGV